MTGQTFLISRGALSQVSGLSLIVHLKKLGIIDVIENNKHVNIRSAKPLKKQKEKI